MLKIKNKNKGFSLLELMLWIGIVSVMLIATYSLYKNKMIAVNVENEITNIDIVKKSIDNIYLGSNNFATLTVANIVNANILPPQMINGANIKSAIGNNITFNQIAIGGFNGYEIQINNVKSEECTKFSTSKFISNAEGLRINGVFMKADNTQLTALNIGAITNACSVGGVNNQINIRVIPYRDTVAIPLPPAAIRAKEDPFFVPATGYIVPAGAGCNTGVTGATWNQNHCSCPTGTKWDGITCKAWQSRPGWCQYGQMVSTVTGNCVAIPATPATTNIYKPTAPANQAACNADPNGFRSPGGYWTGTVCLGIKPSAIKGVGSVTTPIAVATTPVYSIVNPNDSGRNLPAPPLRPLKLTTPQALCQNAGGFYDGVTCNICPNINIVKNAAGANIALFPAPNVANQATLNWSVIPANNNKRCARP